MKPTETNKKGYYLTELLRVQVWLDPGAQAVYQEDLSLFPFVLLQVLVGLFHFQTAYLSWREEEVR